MLTFVLAIAFSIIVSLCIYGKSIKDGNTLINVGLMMFLISFISTIVVSTISLKYLDKEYTVAVTSKLSPISYKYKVLDTVLVQTISEKDTINSRNVRTLKTTNYITYNDSLSSISILVDEDTLNFNTDEIMVTIGYYENPVLIRHDNNYIPNIWVSGMSLPVHDSKFELKLNEPYYAEYIRSINKHKILATNEN